MTAKARKVGDAEWEKLPAFEVDERDGKWVGIARIRVGSKTESEPLEIRVTGDDPFKVLYALAKSTKLTLKALKALARNTGQEPVARARKGVKR